MHAHCAACFMSSERSDLICANDWNHSPSPALWVGFTRQEIFWRFHESVPLALRGKVARLLETEAFECEGSQHPRHDAQYRQYFSSTTAVSGPTYWMPGRVTSSTGTTKDIFIEDSGLLRGSELDAWIPDIPHQQPMVASIEQGRAVAICASVRITSRAHEAGVETLTAFRGRGHGAAAVAAWAKRVSAAGAVPLYSTSWQNVASQGVARRVGFRAFGWEYRVGPGTSAGAA